MDKLLHRTSLAAVISTAKSIADRLDFLKSLELLLFDASNKKTLLERSQLHRILDHETWVFGEEFSLMGNDSSLTTVLRRHVRELGREELAVTTPVRDEQGRLQIVDLAMGRVAKRGENQREHLVVELKRPSVVLGRKELAQIQGYATAVAKDSRFNKTDVNWSFVLVGNEWDDFVDLQARQHNRPLGLIMDSGGIKVWAKTWSQVLADSEHRLKFVQGQLEIIPSEDEALEYLKDTHSKYLPDNLQSED